MQENNWNLETDSEDNFNIKQQLERYIVHYKWFLLSIIVFIIGAFLYLRYSTPQYNVVASVLIKDDKKLLPLKPKETYYYIPLEEAPYLTYLDELKKNANVILKKTWEISTIPANSKVIVGFHKDNSTAYKPYKITETSKRILLVLSQNQNVILNVFGSAYALKDIDISKISTVLVSYENNDDSMKATAKALHGKTKISGRLPVLVNDHLNAGMGLDLNASSK